MKKIFLPVFLLITLLSACSTVELDDEDKVVDVTDDTYMVTFITDGGTAIDTVSVNESNEFELPVDPTKTGYAFGGWFLDADFLTQYQITTSIDSDTSLYAKWSPIRSIVTVNHEDDVLGSFSAYYDIESELAILNYEYYEFLGWYSDPEYTNLITSVIGTLEDQTIYLKLETKEINMEVEDAIDFTTLPYYEYLKESNPVVTITVKDVGVMTLELFPDVAPNTVDNFISYIKENAYTDSSFHRVISDFMIQGGIVESNHCAINGDFTLNGFTNDLQHYRGVLSMARTNVMNSATSQFFIMHADSHFLDENYASFGGLTSGFNVLDYIAGIDTLSTDAPVLTVTIESITVDLNGYEPGTVVCTE